MLNFLNFGLAAGRWRRAAILGAAALLFSPQVLALTFDVGSTSDAVDDNPGDGLCHTAAGDCTLRAAIQEANAWPGPDVIRLKALTYTLSIQGRGEDSDATGDLDIKESVDIRGVDQTSSIIDGGGVDRVLDIFPGAVVNVSNVTIRNGLIVDPPGDCSSNASYIADPGAGIRNQGSLTLSDSALNGNVQKCSGGGAIANQSGDVHLLYDSLQGNQGNAGGAINQNFGLVELDHTRLYSNTAGGPGGGIFAFNGTVTVTDSIIDNNKGTVTQNGLGGGIANEGGSVMTIKSSLISRNQTAVGGGVDNCCGTSTLYLINSTVTGNSALRGGGINSEYNTYIYNTTISNNEADGLQPQGTSTLQYGSGIYYDGGVLRLSSSILNSNNKATSEPDNCEKSGGSMTSLGNNIDSDGTCQLTGSDDRNVDPKLGGITFGTNQQIYPNNGGATPTQMLLAGSPAIDGGPATGCKDQNGDDLTTDQRGFSRPVDGNGDTAIVCDVGAVEVRSDESNLADLSVHVTQSANPIDTGSQEIYTVAVSNNGPTAATGVKVTDTLPSALTFNSGQSTSGCGLSGGDVVCTIATSISPGTTVNLAIAADAAGNASGTLSNVATVSMTGGQTDPNTANNTDTTTTTVNAVGDLQIAMTGTPNPAVLNVDQVTYNITVTANPGVPVPNTVVTDTLPSNANLVAGSSQTSKGSCTENAGAKTVTCSLGTMTQGDVVTISLKVTPAAKGTMTNTAVVNFQGTDTNAQDNKTSVDTTVQVHADLATIATAVTASPNNGDPFATLIKDDLTYIANIVNNGPSQSTDVTFTASLPAGATFVSAKASRGKPCTQSGGAVSCDLQAMASDAQATVTIFVIPTVVGALNFQASAAVASDETDPVSGNNSATLLNTAVDNPSAADADLGILLSGSPLQVAANASLTYTMSVSNNGPDPAQGVVAALSLPASVTVPPVPSGCSKDSQTVVVRCSLGTINAGGTGQIQVTVTPTKGGIINATASVSFLGQDSNTNNNLETIATTVTGTASGSSGGSGGGGGTVDATALAGLLLFYTGAAVRRRNVRR